MLDLSVFNGLPEINVLKEQEITLEKIQGELTADFENKFAELEGLDDFTLAATDERRLILDAIGGEFYLFAQYINLCMRQNFLPYMYGPYLKNWAANLGIFESGKEAASCEVKFSLSAVQPTDTTIPEGTRVSAGDNVFFATTEDLVIAAGELNGTVSVKCTEEGTLGNNYAIGQLTTIVDPVNYVSSATNTTATSGGHDEYTNDELREVILNKPYTFSNAGPVGAYEAKVKEYSSAIADVKCITNDEALVQIYIILQNGAIPSTNYCTNVENYILESRQFPDTDMIKVLPAVAHAYTITATYYIDAENEDSEDTLKEAIQDAIKEFTIATASSIGAPINPNNIVTYAMAAGAARIDIEAPESFIEMENAYEVGICPETDIVLTYGGLL